MWLWKYYCQVCAEESGDEYVCPPCKQIQKYIAIHGPQCIMKDLEILYNKDPTIRIHTRSITKSKL